MEQLSEDEGRVLDEILEALELEAGEKDGTGVGEGGGQRSAGGRGSPAGLASDG